MINNFNGLDEIELLLIPVVKLTATRHHEDAVRILMELPATIDWRNKSH